MDSKAAPPAFMGGAGRMVLLPRHTCLPCPLLWHQKELSVWLWGKQNRVMSHSQAMAILTPMTVCHPRDLLFFLAKFNLDGAVGATGYQNKTEGTGKLDLWTKIDGQRSKKQKQIQIFERGSNSIQTGT